MGLPLLSTAPVSIGLSLAFTPAAPFQNFLVLRSMNVLAKGR